MKALRPKKNPAQDLGNPCYQRRLIPALQPHRHGRYIFDHVGDVVGQGVDRDDKEVTGAHGRIQCFEPQHRFRRIEPCQRSESWSRKNGRQSCNAPLLTGRGRSRSEPYDVEMCGGGMTGVGAAPAAARNGLKTLIVEGQGQLGGMGTSGLESHWLGGRTNGCPLLGGRGIFREPGTEGPSGAITLLAQAAAGKGLLPIRLERRARRPVDRRRTVRSLRHERPA